MRVILEAGYHRMKLRKNAECVAASWVYGKRSSSLATPFGSPEMTGQRAEFVPRISCNKPGWRRVQRKYILYIYIYIYIYGIINIYYINIYWLPRCCSGKDSVCECRRCKRHGFNPWVRRIPWSRKWRLTSVFLPGELHGQRSQVGTIHGVTKSWT